MLNKFQRNYELTVQGNDGNLHTFNYPLTLDFQVKRNVLSSANTGNFRIYNLGQNTRDQVFKDQFSQSLSFRSLILKAGYGNTIPVIFNGNVKMAQSYRLDRSVNFITEIEGYDYGWVMVNAKSSFNISGNVTTRQIINQLIKDLQMAVPGNGLSVGAISNKFDTTYTTRGISVVGSSWDNLQKFTNNQTYIDNGNVYCLFENDVFEGDLTVIDSETGLLGTPKKADRLITMEILFEPRLSIGQQISLQSRSLTQFNGNYKVVGIEHQGTISGAVGGQCKTIVSALLPFEKINLLSGN